MQLYSIGCHTLDEGTRDVATESLRRSLSQAPRDRQQISLRGFVHRLHQLQCFLLQIVQD